MPDSARIERIRADAHAAINRATTLIERVDDPMFKATVGRVRQRLGDVESFFLNHVKDLITANEDLWLTAAERSLRGDLVELKSWEDVAASRNYRIESVGG